MSFKMSEDAALFDSLGIKLSVSLSASFSLARILSLFSSLSSDSGASTLIEILAFSLIYFGELVFLIVKFSGTKFSLAFSLREFCIFRGGLLA